MKEATVNLVLSLILTCLTAGCAHTLLIQPTNITLPRSPLIECLPFTVGVYYSSEFRYYRWVTQDYVDPSPNLSGIMAPLEFVLGPPSVTLFDQVFPSMFAKAVRVEKRAPLKTDEPKLEGVVEVRLNDFHAMLKNIPPDPQTPSSIWRFDGFVSITYGIALYSPNGDQLGSWTVSGSGKSEFHSLDAVRAPAEYCLHAMYFNYPRAFASAVNVQALSEATQLAMQDAAAQFMVGFRDQPGIREWLRQTGLDSGSSSP